MPCLGNHILMEIKAKYIDGMCEECGMSLEQGRMIVYDRREWRALVNAWVMMRP